MSEVKYTSPTSTGEEDASEATPETYVTNSGSESVSDSGWISRLVRLQFLRKDADSVSSGSKDILDQSALLTAANESVHSLSNLGEERFKGSGIDISKESNGLLQDDDDCDQGLCMLETIEERVMHDRESLSMFLHEVPVAEVQAISKLCVLSNLAYMIPEVQSKDLLKDQHLTFVTSSLVKKEEADVHASLEHAFIHATKRKNGAKKRQNCPLEESAASYEDPSHNKATPSSEDIQLKVEASHLLPRGQDVIAANINEEPSSSGETLTEAAAKEGTLSKVRNSCPCEWFICDDEHTSTRYLVIQGSESLASWQTNLSFDPTKFEGLGVLVHRGVYEAAQRLYELVEREMIEHVRKGSHARLCFTGHSLGGSLATLIAMMLVKRGVVGADAVEGVVTLGAPCVLCAGERVLQQLHLQEKQFTNVMMHRDIVPRAFACDYPLHVARLLQRVNGTFRDHPCLNYQQVLYAPVGQMMILQPDDAQSPSHPLLPSIAGLYLIRHPSHHEQQQELQAAKKVREAQRAFFNMPHPLDVLRDPGAYGFEGAISRDHDPRSYKRAINTVLAHGLRRLRRLRSRSRSLLSIHTALPTHPSTPAPASSSPQFKCHPLIPSEHIHMGLLCILSITADLFSSFISWA